MTMKTLSTILILISFTASLYYLFVGIMKPETVAIYNNANIPRWGIQLWALVLGISGILLVMPSTFKIAGILLILGSLFTIVCFVITKDFKGGALEFVFLQIPIFLLWAGYPIEVLDKVKNWIN